MATYQTAPLLGPKMAWLDLRDESTLLRNITHVLFICIITIRSGVHLTILLEHEDGGKP